MIRIKQRRLARGWTIEQLSHHSGIAASTISHYESSRRMPRRHNLLKLAEALGCTTDYLFGKTDPDPDETRHALLATYDALPLESRRLLLRLARALCAT